MPGQMTNKSPWWKNGSRSRGAEKVLIPEFGPARVGGTTAWGTIVDRFRAIERKRRYRSTRQSYVGTAALGARTKTAKDRSAAVVASVDQKRAEWSGLSDMVPPVWVVVAVCVAIIEWFLSKFLVSLIIPDESNIVVRFATAAVASTMFAVTHAAGTSIQTWIDAPEGIAMERSKKRRAIFGVIALVGYIVVVTVSLVSVNAAFIRYAFTYFVLFGSTIVQGMRPKGSMATWLFEVTRDIGYKFKFGRLSRRAGRSYNKLCNDWFRLGTYWNSGGAKEQMALAGWGLDYRYPGSDVVVAHQAVLVDAAYLVSPEELIELGDKLIEAGVEPKAVNKARSALRLAA